MKKFYLLTYGCQMNESDSDIIRQALTQNNYQETYFREEADYFILNTCSIRERAVRRVVGQIHDLQQHRRQKPELKIAVGGCVTQLEGKDLAEKVSGIDLICGTSNFHRLPEFLEELSGTNKPLIRLEDPTISKQNDLPVKNGGHRHSTCFLPIMRGCDNFCAYCVVPYSRGREISYQHAKIIEQINILRDLGQQDITLVGQNVNSYQDGDVNFAGLLRTAAATGIPRIRFITSHPRDMSREIIDVVAERPNLCPRFHLPLQSGSDKILGRMNRHYDRKKYLATARYIRATIPGSFLSTDIIVGFPGETEEDFQQTIELMKEIRFDLSYMFKFSSRPGTKAHKMTDDVSAAEKQRRLEIIIATQNELSKLQNDRFLEKAVEVLVEGPSKKRATEMMGRTEQGLTVIFKGDNSWRGKMIPVRITETYIGTLKGEALIA